MRLRPKVSIQERGEESTNKQFVERRHLRRHIDVVAENIRQPQMSRPEQTALRALKEGAYTQKPRSRRKSWQESPRATPVTVASVNETRRPLPNHSFPRFPSNWPPHTSCSNADPHFFAETTIPNDSYNASARRAGIKLSFKCNREKWTIARMTRSSKKTSPIVAERGRAQPGSNILRVCKDPTDKS